MNALAVALFVCQKVHEAFSAVAVEHVKSQNIYLVKMEPMFLLDLFYHVLLFCIEYTAIHYCAIQVR